MKKRVSLILAAAMLLTVIAGTGLFASAATGVGKVEQDGVTVDGSLTEWADAPPRTPCRFTTARALTPPTENIASSSIPPTPDISPWW